MDDSGSEGQPALGETRRARVLELLQAAGQVSISELQSRFGVSSMTARRDLAVLAERGALRRTHGGAVIPTLVSGERPFSSCLRETPDDDIAKLADAAFSLIQPGESVFLDASAAACAIARRIAASGLRIRVLTNSLPVLQVLATSSDPAQEIVAIGGSFRPATCCYLGPAAVQSIRAHFADRVFFSVTGITPRGVMTDDDVLEAEVRFAMIEQSEQPVLALEESMLSTRGRQAIAPVDAASLVLAHGLSARGIRQLHDAGATIRLTGD